MSAWKWCGSAHHFVGARNCDYGMATMVGEKRRFIVSTVGEYLPDHLREEGARDYQPIRFDRLYETFVFEAGGSESECGLFETKSFSEIDAQGYNDARSAGEGHLAMCRKWDMEGTR